MPIILGGFTLLWCAEMKGARGYTPFLKSGRYGQLEVVVGEHARGHTLQVYVHSKRGPYKVEVYGIIGGQPGWTEEYGWIHEGPWVQDFEKLVLQGEQAAEREKLARKELLEARENARQAIVKEVLGGYESGV